MAASYNESWASFGEWSVGGRAPDRAFFRFRDGGPAWSHDSFRRSDDTAMGIKFLCDSCGKKLNVKAFLAGKRGICPHCGSKIHIPANAGDGQPGDSMVAAGGGTAATAAPAVAADPSAAPVGGPAAVTTTPRAVPTGPAPSAAMAHPATPAAAHAVAAAPATAVAPGGIASDPIAEAPHAVWYVRPASGNQFGPAAGDIMRRWIAEGRVAGDSLVWREGWADWKSASTIFPDLAGGRSGPAAGGAGDAIGLSRVGSDAAPYRARPRKSNTMVVAMLIVLAVASIGLLVALVAILGNSG